MGCNGGCGGGQAGQTIGNSVAQRRARSGAMPLGFHESNPVTLGDPDEQMRRVRVAIPVAGLARNQSAWVTGQDAQQHFDSGALVDITGTTQKSRMWMVPGAPPFTYTDWQEAIRVAAAYDTTPIEVA